MERIRRIGSATALGGTLGLSALLVGLASVQPPRVARLPGPAETGVVVKEANVLAHVEFLADDALQGRRSASRDEWIAAVYVGSHLRRFGVEPAGDAGPGGRRGFVQVVPAAKGGHGTSCNAVGILRGSDPALAEEAIVISAHLDHLGAEAGREGDSIFNGADDNASGVAAVLELARVLGSTALHRRTAIFLCCGSEETDGAGVNRFLDDPPVPIDRMVACINFEMIGNPDPTMPEGTIWLTGFERSDLGPELARQGMALVADPYPKENFFQRSDNYAMALKGVVAHTFSTFGRHARFHRPDDDLAHIDFPHLTRTINAMVKPVRWLVNHEFRPKWHPGKKP
jgi:hypothetical protein